MLCLVALNRGLRGTSALVLGVEVEKENASENIKYLDVKLEIDSLFKWEQPVFQSRIPDVLCEIVPCPSGENRLFPVE